MINDLKKLWWLITKKKRKVVIAPGIAGLGLSDVAVERLFELGVPKEDFDKLDHAFGGDDSPNQIYYGYVMRMARDDPRLVQVIEELEYKACGRLCHSIAVVQIPMYIDYIVETDGETGCEWIAEQHKTWSADSDPNFIRYQSTSELRNDIEVLVEGITEYPWKEADKKEAQIELMEIHNELIRRGEMKRHEAFVPAIVIVKRD